MVNFTKILIPFSYSDRELVKNGFCPVEEKEGKAYALFEEYSFRGHNLLPNVSNRLTDKDNKIGSSFVLTNQGRAFLSVGPVVKTFPSNKALKFEMRTGSALEVSITNIYVHLFESNVGFLEYEITANVRNPEEYVDLNYFACEFKNPNNVFSFEKKLSANETETITFSLPDITMKILSYISGAGDFDGNKELNFRDSKPLCFGYLSGIPSDRDLGDILGKAKYSYKESYKTNGPGNVYSAFENSVFGCSERACINLVKLTGENSTDSFFEETYPDNLKKTYFYLYLLILNEKFTLVKRISQSEKTTVTKSPSSMSEIEAAVDDVNLIVEKNYKLKSRCDFVLVSMVEHIQEYFTYVKKSLKIEDYLERIEERNNEYLKMLKLYKFKLENEKSKRLKENEYRLEVNRLTMEIIVFIITNIVGSVFIFDKISELFIMFGINITGTGYLIIPIAVTLLYFGVLFVQTVIKIKEVRLRIQKHKENLE